MWNRWRRWRRHMLLRECCRRWMHHHGHIWPRARLRRPIPWRIILSIGIHRPWRLVSILSVSSILLASPGLASGSGFAALCISMTTLIPCRSSRGGALSIGSAWLERVVHHLLPCFATPSTSWHRWLGHLVAHTASPRLFDGSHGC